jgi:hypothetical protein
VTIDKHGNSVAVRDAHDLAGEGFRGSGGVNGVCSEDGKHRRE